jgi:hypothetical protein
MASSHNPSQAETWSRSTLTIAAAEGNTALAVRLWGFADAYGRWYAISRYRISFALRERLIQRLEVLSPDDCAALMAEGAAWSEDESQRPRSRSNGEIRSTQSLHHFRISRFAEAGVAPTM